MTSRTRFPSNPMSAMAGAYAAAFEQGFRAWAKQSEAWRAAFTRPAAWPSAVLPSVFPFDREMREMADALIDSLSVQVVEEEDRVAFRVTCLDMRIDMMITHLGDGESGRSGAIDASALKLGAAS
jgi:hypothetical protein